MKQLTAITNAHLVLETGILRDSVLLLQGDTILHFGKKADLVFVDAQFHVQQVMLRGKLK